MKESLDKTSKKEIIGILEGLGISDKAARVYIALLPLAQTGTNAIIKAAGLHSQFVYQALEQLEELGLVQHVVQNGRKKFIANSPERILHLVDKKRLAARMVVSQLQTSVEVPSSEQSFEVFQGRDSFVANELAILTEIPEGSTLCITGGGNDIYTSLLGVDANEYERIRVGKKIAIRYISTSGNINYLKIVAQTREMFDYRVLPESAENQNTLILQDKIAFYMYGDPVLVFVFKNKEITKGYQKFFEVLWSLGSK